MKLDVQNCHTTENWPELNIISIAIHKETYSIQCFYCMILLWYIFELMMEHIMKLVHKCQRTRLLVEADWFV